MKVFNFFNKNIWLLLVNDKYLLYFYFWWVVKDNFYFMIEDSFVILKGVFVDDDKCDEVFSNIIVSFMFLCIRVLKVVDLVICI